MRRKKEYFDTVPEAPAPVIATVFHRVKFSEVDALGIAWHGHCPSFFEEAHTILMEHVGLGYAEYRKHGIGAPIVQFHADYYSPLLLDETVEIRAELKYNEGARINVEYQIFHADGQLAIGGYTVQMFFNQEGHEPYLIDPNIYSECKKRWRAGEFNE